MSSKKRGPPTSNVPTQGKFKSRRFEVSNTNPRSGDLSGVGVSTGSKGKIIRGGNGMVAMVPNTRSSSLAAITGYMGSVSYAEAITQVPDDTYNPRVFYQKHAREPKLRRKDVNTDKMILFYRNPGKRAAVAEYARRQNLAPETARSYAQHVGGTPLEAVDFFTIPELNYMFAEEREITGSGPYPSPMEVMADYVLHGVQNNQAGGQEVGGEDRGFRPNKLVNCIIHGDAAGYQIWPDRPEDQDVLYLVVTRFSRADLEAAGLLRFILDPNTGTTRVPGDTGVHRGVKRSSDRQMVKNPLRIFPMTAKGGGVPHVEDAYDDNGYKVTPLFIKIGRFSYDMTPPTGNFDPVRATVDLRTMMQAGTFNFSMIPVKH